MRHIQCCVVLFTLLTGSVAVGKPLRVWVVPIVNQGRFVETLLEPFATAHNLELEVTAVHGRAVVAAAEEGKADLIITHGDFGAANRLEDKSRIGSGEQVFANPIVLLAPVADPAGVAGTQTPEEAIVRIQKTKRCVMRNGLRHLEMLNDMDAAKVRCKPDSEIGAGLEAVLAARKSEAYVWWGLHPFLMSDQAMTPVVFKDPRLLRRLKAWVVAGANEQDARAAIDYLRSAPAQHAVAEFRFPQAPLLQAWSPVAALDRLALIQARDKVIVILKNDKARAADDHRDPAHREKRAFELRIAREIVTRLLGSSDKMVLLVRQKPDRIPAIARGDADLGIAMLSPSPSVHEVDFSRPYFHDGLALMSQPEHVISDAAQLRGKKILTLARDEYGQREEAKRITAVLGEPLATTLVADFRTAANRINAGEAVGLLSMGANIERFLARHPGGMASSPLLTHEQFAVAIPKDSPALAAAVNAVIEDLDRSGQLAAWREEAGLRRGE